MIIDECALFCPFRVTQQKGAKITTLSDHNAILLSLEIPRLKASVQEKHEGNWILDPERYSDMSKIFDEQCLLVDIDQDTQPLYDDVENMINETLDQCFRKTKKRKTDDSFSNSIHYTYKPVCKKLTKFASRGKVQRKVANQYREKILQMNTETVSEINKQKLHKRIENLSENDRFSAQKFWREKKAILGTHRSCNSVYDVNGREVFDPEEIIAAYQNEFDNRLSSVEIKSSLQNYKLLSDRLCDEIIKTTKNVNVPDFTFEEMDKITCALKKGKSFGPDKKPAEVYMYGGEKLKSLILCVINKVKNTHLTPHQWEMMMITPLFKGKGSKKDLVNQRGIFLTQVISKIWERLIKERTKDVVSKINPLQAGSRTGKCPGDQVFLLRTCVTHAKYLNQNLFLNFYDFRQCFDKLWLEDSIISLYKLGLNNELLASIYETNSSAKITVNTPLGKSQSFTKSAIVKQGSVLASCLCCATTAEFCDELKGGGMPIGRIIINSLAYVDDLLTVNNNVVDSNGGHKNVVFFSDKKKQPLNEDKCVLLPVNCKKTDAIPIQEVNGKQVQIVDKAKYLGDIFNKKGDYKDLMDDRTRKGTVCTINSFAICSESLMGNYVLHSLILLYKTVFLQTVLYNSGTWNNLAKNDLTRLTSAQNKYLKWMLHTPRGTCTSFTLLELGLLPISQEIVLRKFNFLHHILTLPTNDPVKAAYNEQKLYASELNWYNEICALMEQYGLELDEESISRLSKCKWKEISTAAVRQTTLEELYLDCTSKSKTANVPRYADLEQQEYLMCLSPKRARIYFQLRAGVFDFKCNRSYKYTDETCRLCGNGLENTDHIINHCSKIQRSADSFECIYSTSGRETLELIDRVEQFQDLLDDIDQETT